MPHNKSQAYELMCCYCRLTTDELCSTCSIGIGSVMAIIEKYCSCWLVCHSQAEVTFLMLEDYEMNLSLVVDIFL
jgi:hypothetical protein